MNLNDAPDFIIKRILVLTDRVKALADQRDAASNKLKRARADLESPRFQNDLRELQDQIDHVRTELYKIERMEQAAKEAKAMGGSVIDHPKNKAELTVKKVSLEKEMGKLAYSDDRDHSFRSNATTCYDRSRPAWTGIRAPSGSSADFRVLGRGQA